MVWTEFQVQQYGKPSEQPICTGTCPGINGPGSRWRKRGGATTSAQPEPHTWNLSTRPSGSPITDGHEAKLTKAQRNIHCEPLAMLAAIMTRREELQGGTLLILSESTASLDNLNTGTSADDQGQQSAGQMLHLVVMHRIEYWVD